MKQRLKLGACANGALLKRLLLAGREPRRSETDNHLHVYDYSPAWERISAGEMQK